MHWSSQVAVVVGVSVLCWLLGTIIPAFAIPLGQLALFLLWALAPWYLVVAGVGIVWLLTVLTLGPISWPYLLAIFLASLAAMLLGSWWRAGTGITRALIVTVPLLWGPWLLFRMALMYTPNSTAHLSWIPAGLATLIAVWIAVLFAREYEPRRKPYRLGVYQ